MHQPSGFSSRMRQFRYSILDTVMTLEGVTTTDDEAFVLPRPLTSRLSLDFERGGVME